MRKELANFAALGAIQVSNAALPLIVFPYALGVVGAGLYAKLAMTEAFAIAALTVVLYSFEVDGVARVVRLGKPASPEALSQVFSEVLYVRLLLFVLCAAGTAAAWPYVDAETAQLMALWLLFPLSYVLQSTWFFQVMERNVAAAAFTVASRALGVVLVLALVKAPSDVFWVPALIGGCYLLGGCCSFAHACMAFGVRLRPVAWSTLWQAVTHGWHVFIGNMAVICYRDFNVVILGLAHGNEKAVAVYSIAEKVVKGIQAATRPLSQIFTPKALHRLGTTRQADTASLKDLLPFVWPQWLALAILLVIGTALYVGAAPLVPRLTAYPLRAETAALVALMSTATFFGVANYMLGSAGLNFLGGRAYLYRSILSVGLISLALCTALSAWLGATGTALSFVVAEVMLLILIVRRYLRTPPAVA